MKSRAKEKTVFVCTSCGQTHHAWMGKCSACGEWNSIIEEKVSSSKQVTGTADSETSVPINSCTIEQQALIPTGLSEFDLLLGKGLAPESSLLIGGEPGIGKSTLMLQVAGLLAEKGITSLYLSGEESLQQLGLRGKRLQIENELVQIATVRELPQVKSLTEKSHPAVVIIDSVQTLYDPELESAPGTVSQIRSCAAELADYCKRKGIILILIGHITKEGAIAGPKILEHLVDVVLYFEGEKNNLFRILRARKNRFGPTSEIGIFEIGNNGLIPVTNPSELFLDEYPPDVSGRVVVTAVEGQRPLLLELQALVSRTNFGFPQRVASGFDLKRLNLMLAILEKRQKLEFGQQDVYVNLAGGLRVDDPSLDLGLITAVISSFEDIPVKPQTVVIGEVGLSGEVRAVPYIDRRLSESAKLGFSRAVIPKRNLKGLKKPQGIEVFGLESLNDLPKYALS
jgi:DNA repair protein RadA/Sms